MIVKGIAKKYMGAISSEMKAARLYDKYSIIIQGLNVRLVLYKIYRLRQISLTQRKIF